jgi:hypothetical protein
VTTYSHAEYSEESQGEMKEGVKSNDIKRTSQEEVNRIID